MFRIALVLLLPVMALALLGVWLVRHPAPAPAPAPVAAPAANFRTSANPFQDTWERVDKPVKDLPGVNRGYTWGPALQAAASVTSESYNGGSRAVAYYDKARMEINNPAADPSSLFYVSTGLLVKELVTGQRQDGDNNFTSLTPGTIQVAGDPNDGGANAIAPTYASFKNVVTFFGNENGQSSAPGSLINSRIDKAGNVSSFNPPEQRTVGGYDPNTRHNIADVFVDYGKLTGLIWEGGKYVQGSVFFNNPTYVLGRPVTEPYWTRAVVGGVEKDVLVQLFERRVLTYTPDNPAAFKVEMGNVGQHYYKWRYSAAPGNSPAPTAQPAPAGVSPSRLARLTKGVDLTLWFWVDNTDDPPIKSFDHYANYITASDLQTIKQLGFRHVRLSITPAALFQENSPATLNPQVLPYLDKALDLILSYNLGVIIDMHFDVEGQSFKNRLVNDSSFADKYGQFWKSLARHLSSRDPEMVFLEVLNEPTQPDPVKWYAVQEKILAAMREGAPNHTLIADSNNEDADGNPEPAAFLLMTPVKDPNVVYNLHFYEPQTFTGQGQIWSNLMKQIKGLPYPYDAAACQQAVNKISNARPKALAKEYCTQQWDAAKLDAKLKQVADWASRYGVNVTINEFGAYANGIEKETRLRWFKDVRTLFEKYNFGWTLWGYDDAFGLNHTEESGNTLDMDVVQALGLGTS